MAGFLSSLGFPARDPLSDMAHPRSPGSAPTELKGSVSKGDFGHCDHGTGCSECQAGEDRSS